MEQAVFQLQWILDNTALYNSLADKEHRTAIRKKRKTISPTPWLRAQAADWMIQSGPGKVVWEIHIDPDLPQILGAPTYLSQAIHNILHASRMAAQAVTMPVKIKAVHNPPFLEIRFLQKALAVFESLVQEFKKHPLNLPPEMMRTLQGAGLALAVANLVATIHDGGLSLRSTESPQLVLQLPVRKEQPR